jgi:hypothetical protein
MGQRSGRVLYIDPSYTCTGLFMVDHSTRRMVFGKIDPDRATMRSYGNYFATAQAVLNGLDSILFSWSPSIVKLEVPPPFGQTSAGLTGLSFLLLARILRTPGLERVELINPAFISRYQRAHFTDETSRSRIAAEFLRRQGDLVRGVSMMSPELIEDNDVATAYLFYAFEKLIPTEGSKDFTVLPMVNSVAITATTKPTTPTSPKTTTITTTTKSARGRSRSDGVAPNPARG